jgi:hypothetical protein
MTGSLVDRNVAVIVAAGDTSRTGSEGCNGNPGRAPAINSFGGSAAMQLALDSLRLGRGRQPSDAHLVASRHHRLGGALPHDGFRAPPGASGIYFEAWDAETFPESTRRLVASRHSPAWRRLRVEA